MDSARVGVVGAGIGGLTLAAALKNRGFEVEVFEQAPELRQQGSGLSLYTNAVAVLHDIGLEEVLEGIAEPVERMLALSARGSVLTELDTGSTSQRFSAPNVNVHRGELLAALSGTVGEENITFGSQCVGFERDTDGVRLSFADGTESPADLLVAADGAGSVVRNSIHGEKAGEGARHWAGWQGIASSRPAGVPEQACVFVLSGHSVAGLLPLTEGRLHWFIDDPAAKKPAADESGNNQASELLEKLAEDWPPVVREAVSATLPDSVTYDRVRDRIPTQQWGEGRVTLLGDAAHPMLPTLGQGACQSIEDAAVLVRCLGAETDAALREYERVRSKRATAFVRASRRSSDFRSRMPPALRDAVMRAVPRRLLSYAFNHSISPAKESTI